MNKIAIQHHACPAGNLIIGTFREQVVLCDWQHRKSKIRFDKVLQEKLQAEFVNEKTSMHESVINQLSEYFNEERMEFDLPIKLIGTPFQVQVWDELLKIPYGKTETYLSLSNKINNPKAIRAVAAANASNVISIIIPCHRVIGGDGKLIGYSGGLPAKRKLLELEQSLPFMGQSTLF